MRSTALPRALLLTSLLSAAVTSLAGTRREAGSHLAAETASDPASWVVVSATALDPRIEAQVNQLAAQNQAAVTVVKSRVQAASRHPALTIELRSATNARSFELDLERYARSSKPTPETIGEGYLLSGHYETAPGPFELRQLDITAISPEGFHNGLTRLGELLRELASRREGKFYPEPKTAMITTARRATSVQIADFPSFGVRGVVEGFYGTPWSHQDRLDILRFEGGHNMNSYYYAPKDDPYHREHWRDPYPPDRTAQLGELAQVARANFVDFCFAVSPGLSMAYSSDDDFAKLTEKLDSVGKLGISCYALFLDDVPEELQNPADKARFRSLAQAHAYIINKLYRHVVSLSPQNHLTVTPTTYTNGFGSRDYIRDLGAAVDPHVDLVWTGTEVVSPTITVAQTQDWSKLLQRSPLIWDNYPVNDYIRWRPFLGPLVGRDADLNLAVRGLVSNPMNEAHASMISLATIAEYLWNPAAYDPAASDRRALVAQYGQDAPQLLAPLLQSYSDYGWQDNVFKPLWALKRLPIDTPEMDRRLASMDSSLQAISARAGFEKLVAELSPFIGGTRARLQALAADPGFKRLNDGELQWNETYEVLTAARLAAAPALDGDFSKWQAGKIFSLQLLPPRGADSTAAANSSSSFGGRFALGWDDAYLYVGADVTDPDIDVPPPGGDITDGDMVVLAVETAFRRNYYSTSAAPDAFAVHLSPGNFRDVAAKQFLRTANLAPRIAGSKDEIKALWKKTTQGYSGDIAIPAAYFEGKLEEGYEIGLLVEAQKVTPPDPATADPQPHRTWLISKQDLLFRPAVGNPASYQRLVLLGTNR
ncbi:MAG TPA: beta-N-acetylglucosaminidase domain-containing protein [Terriglobia bacterium]